MTGLLVSVRSSTEAHLACRGGADIIDVKEPRLGSLGAASPMVWREVYDEVKHRVPVSVALGELCDEQILRPPGRFAFAKIGLARCLERSDWQAEWASQMESLDPATGRVAVAYADWQHAGAPHPTEVLERGWDLGCSTLLLDTHQKSTGGLFCFLTDRVVQRLMDQAHRQQMMTVLAGSLRGPSFDAAVDLGPDYVAVRGAACTGERTGQVDVHLVRRLKERIEGRGASTRPSKGPLSGRHGKPS